MASAGRFAAIISRRSLRLRSNSILKTLGPNQKPAPALSSSTSQFPFAASRLSKVCSSVGKPGNDAAAA